MGNYAFSYPVLGINNSVEGSFTLKLSIKRLAAQKKVVFLPESINIDNDEINALLENKSAEIKLRIYCSSTFYSGFHNIEEDFPIYLNENLLINKCEVDAIIVSKLDMPYSLKSFQSIYSDLTFDILKGDIIGTTETLKWYVPRSYEKKASNSIFVWQQHEDETDRTITYTLDDQELSVLYPKHKYNEVNMVPFAFKKSAYLAFWSFVVPVLTEAFKEVLSEDSAYKEHRWYHYLEAVKKNKNLESDDAYVLAQSAFANGLFDKMFEEITTS